jgi:hypothetical protein
MIDYDGSNSDVSIAAKVSKKFNFGDQAMGCNF